VTGTRHGAVGIFDDAGDLGPVGTSVEANTDPAAVPDVRGYEEPVRFFVDDLALYAEGRGAPQRQPAVAVVVVVAGHKCFFAGNEPGWRSVTETLGGLGQRNTDGAYPIERRSARHRPTLGFRCGA